MKISIFFLLIAMSFPYACHEKITPQVLFVKENYKHCHYADSNELHVYTWYVPKNEGCCSGKASYGAHEIWEPNQGITRMRIDSVGMNAREIQKIACADFYRTQK